MELSSLWGPWHRAMVAAAGVSVLAACYAVTAWGQGVAERLTEASTVTVTSLRIPEEAWHHFDKAKSAAQHHREDEFERESAKALTIAPAFAEMYLLRATVQSNAHEFEAAVASAQAAAKADPGAMWTSVVLAGAYNGMHRFNYALMVLDAEHGMEAESWQAVYERARAEVGARDAAAALHWSGVALRLAPLDFADVHLVRANAFILGNRLSEATAQMEIYLQSKGPQTHRAEVLAMRDAVKLRMDAAAKSELQARAQLQAQARAQLQAQPHAQSPAAQQVASR